MPRGDKTGPEGRGPRTGRGAGNCSPTTSDVSAPPRPRRGLGMGRGMGQGPGPNRSGRGLGRRSGR
jgi:hypothetical protein